MTAERLYLTGRADADALLARDPDALLLGMVLDQQIPMEKAFLGPAVLAERMGALDVGAIAAVDPDEFKELFSRPPAVHRFPGSMAQRV
ncbi:MAG: HhH-GPD-type base excision DNA repair protein, partial [Nakamurella sp.]